MTIEANTIDVRKLSRYMIRYFGMLSPKCGDLPISPIQGHCLVELGDKSLTIKELAYNLNLDKSNASRAVNSLVHQNLVLTHTNPEDQRSLIVSLTNKGKILLSQLDSQQNQQYAQIMAQLNENDAKQVIDGLKLYQQAMQQVKLQADCDVSLGEPHQDKALASMIRQAIIEFDQVEENKHQWIDNLYQCYQQANGQYWVANLKGKPLGIVGFIPSPENPQTCQLKHVFFAPILRGRGLAKRMLIMAFKQAKNMGFNTCTTELPVGIDAATEIYLDLGFKQFQDPNTKSGFSPMLYFKKQL